MKHCQQRRRRGERVTRMGCTTKLWKFLEPLNFLCSAANMLRVNRQKFWISVIPNMLTASGLVAVDIQAACRGIDTSQWMHASTMHAFRAQLVVNMRQTACSREQSVSAAPFASVRVGRT